MFLALCPSAGKQSSRILPFFLFKWKKTAFLSGTSNFFGPSYFEAALDTTSKIISPKCAAETLEQLLVRLFHITTLITDHQVED